MASDLLGSWEWPRVSDSSACPVWVLNSKQSMQCHGSLFGPGMECRASCMLGQDYTNWITFLVYLPGVSSSLIIIYFYDESHTWKVFQAPSPYINFNAFGDQKRFSPFSRSSHSPVCKVLKCWHRVASEIHTIAAQPWRGDANMSTHMWLTGTNSKIFSLHIVFIFLLD